jgi:hypothetical protein
MSASQSPDKPRISRRRLLQGAGALGMSAASSAWLRPAGALATPATGAHSGAQLPRLSTDHLVVDYLPSQATGWPPEEHARNGVGVTIGGHAASAPFTLEGTPYEISLLAFGQPGNAPNPVYEPEPSDPTIDFKRTLQNAWGTHFSFRYRGGLSGHSAISVQSYSVLVTEPTATHPQLTYGGDLFLVYEPDPASSDPPITADLRWIQVSLSHGRSSTEFAQRANPYYFPGGLTSVYGKPACSFYSAPTGAIASRAPTAPTDPRTGKSSTGFADLLMAESFLVLDTGRKDHAGKGIINILAGVKWGWQVAPAPAS